MRLLVIGLAVLALAVAACKRSKPPSCEQVGAKVAQLLAPADDYARDVGAAFAARCEHDAWSAEMRACVQATRSVIEPKHCRSKLTDAQRTRLDADLAVADRRERARVIPASCERYERAVANLQTCAKVPQDARTDLATKLEAAKQGWPAVADKTTLDPSCASALQAIRAAFAADCPDAHTW